MIPPNRQHLHALAGWALSERSQRANDEAIALDHFRDSCGELASVLREDRYQQRDAWSPPRETVSPVRSPSRIPEEVLQVIAPERDPDAACEHKFDIRTQCCKFCGRTYRDIRGRKAELM